MDGLEPVHASNRLDSFCHRLYDEMRRMASQVSEDEKYGEMDVTSWVMSNFTPEATASLLGEVAMGILVQNGVIAGVEMIEMSEDGVSSTTLGDVG